MTVHTAGLMTIQGVGIALAGAAADIWAFSTVVCGVGVLGTVCCVLLAMEVGYGKVPERRGEGAGEGAGREGGKGRISIRESGLTTI